MRSTPGVYEPRPVDVVRNRAQLVDHFRRLARRIGRVLDEGSALLVIGGDCSILLGAGIATARRGGVGLVHIDSHTDVGHPGNSRTIGSVGGEDRAAAIGVHTDAIADGTLALLLTDVLAEVLAELGARAVT